MSRSVAAYRSGDRVRAWPHVRSDFPLRSGKLRSHCGRLAHFRQRESASCRRSAVIRTGIGTISVESIPTGLAKQRTVERDLQGSCKSGPSVATHHPVIRQKLDCMSRSVTLRPGEHVQQSRAEQEHHDRGCPSNRREDRSSANP